MNFHLTVSQSGWISTTLCLERDEFPSCHRWMNFHCRNAGDVNKSYKTAVPIRLSIEASQKLDKFTKSMDPCRLTPVSTCQCSVHLPTYMNYRSGIAVTDHMSLQDKIWPGIYIVLERRRAQKGWIPQDHVTMCESRHEIPNLKVLKTKKPDKKTRVKHMQAISRSSCINVLSYSKSGKGDILHQEAMLA